MSTTKLGETSGWISQVFGGGNGGGVITPEGKVRTGISRGGEETVLEFTPSEQ